MFRSAPGKAWVALSHTGQVIYEGPFAAIDQAAWTHARTTIMTHDKMMTQISGGGGFIGDRQARAGHVIRAEGIARFLR